MLRQVVRPYVRATPSLQGAQLYLLAKVIIFHQFSTFLCLLFEGQQFECSKCVCDDSNAQCDELFGGMAKLFHQFVDKDGRLRIVNLKYFR